MESTPTPVMTTPAAPTHDSSKRMPTGLIIALIYIGLSILLGLSGFMQAITTYGFLNFTTLNAPVVQLAFLAALIAIFVGTVQRLYWARLVAMVYYGLQIALTIGSTAVLILNQNQISSAFKAALVQTNVNISADIQQGFQSFVLTAAILGAVFSVVASSLVIVAYHRHPNFFHK